MNLIRALFRADGGSRAPDADYWYQPRGMTSLTGLAVTPDTALKLSAVWACVGLISESVSSLPLPMFQYRDDGGKDRAPYHALYETLQFQANAWQTAQQWRQMMTVHALLRGAGFSKLVDGPRGPLTWAEPLNPDWLTLPGAWHEAAEYIYRVPGQPEERIRQDQILRVDGMSLDGWRPCSVIEYARESMGIGLAAEQYAGRVYSQDGRPRGVLEHPGKLSKEAKGNLKESWQESYAGLGNAHKVAILEEGLKFSSISVSPEDAQMIASREFSIEDLARWFRVPPHMIGSTAKVTSWGTGIEQLGIGYVTYTLLPWLKRWEQSIRRDMIFQKQQYFAEHVVDGLLKGDQASRYQAYAIGIQNRWLSPNDVRRLENMNPIPGGDTYENPNISPGQSGTTGALEDLPEWRAMLNGRANGHA